MPNQLHIHCIALLQSLTLILLGSLLTPAIAEPARVSVVISDQVDVDVLHYPAKGESVILWIAPDFGFRKSHHEMALLLANKGFEIWMIDLNEALFLSRGSKAMREIDAKYVADMINAAARKTAKKVILMSGFYGAIPTLRGARYWQMNNQQSHYLQGAILFSPALYVGVPRLGDDPEFVPVVSKTNIPLLIFQGEANASRWQVGNLLTKLHEAGSSAYVTLMPDIASLFYPDERTDKQQAYFETVPQRITQLVRIMDPLPEIPADGEETDSDGIVTGIDIDLRPYQGEARTSPFELMDINNKLYKIDDFKGKVTLVNFWATWCPPCIEEIPSLNRLQKIMNNTDFRLLSINYAEDDETVREFTREVSVEFPVLMDETGEVSRDWKILVLPSTYVIGPDGKIAFGVNAAINWDSPQTVQQLKDLLPSKSKND